MQVKNLIYLVYLNKALLLRTKVILLSDLARLGLQGHDTALVADGRSTEVWQGKRSIHMLLDMKSVLSQATLCLTVRPKQQLFIETSTKPHSHTAIGNKGTTVGWKDPQWVQRRCNWGG